MAFWEFTVITKSHHRGEQARALSEDHSRLRLGCQNTFYHFIEIRERIWLVNQTTNNHIASVPFGKESIASATQP